MRLIDADAFLKRNEVYADCEFNHPKYQDTLREIIEAEPSVDAVEVVHGEWIMCGTFMELNKQMCSKCGKIEFRMSDYCPNCGAKMDGEVKDESV